MSSFYCRPAEKTDLETLNGLLKVSKAHWGYEADFMASFVENLSVTAEILADSITMLVYINEKLGGFYSFAKGEENHIELTHFYLYPDFIGKGWGRKLWGLALETARQKGWNEFLVWSDPHANGFYEKMGCKLIRFQRSSLGEDRYQAVYSRTL